MVIATWEIPEALMSLNYFQTVLYIDSSNSLDTNLLYGKVYCMFALFENSYGFLYFNCDFSNTNNQDSLWLHFLDALRRGLTGVSGKDEVPRLSSVVTVFLARTALVLTNPAHPLFIPLSQYVLAKPSFQLSTVPEFLPLFNSVDVHLQRYVLFLLDMIYSFSARKFKVFILFPQQIRSNKFLMQVIQNQIHQIFILLISSIYY